MAERLKIRLVRCPKCANLLPELHDYSVYKCGGCGAFLRARKNVNGGVSEKLEKEKKGEDFEKLKSLSVKENGDYLEITSANENEINGDFHNKRKDTIFKQRNDDSCQADYVMNRSKSIYSNHSCQTDYTMNRSNSIYSNESCQADYTINRSKSVRTNRGQISESNNRSRFSGFGYPGKGSSSYNLSSSSSSTNGKQVKNFDDAHLDPDRVELLRKLDELKEQIVRNDYERRTYDQHIEVKKFYFPQPHANVYPQFHKVRSHCHSHREYIDYNPENFASYLPPKNARSGSRWANDDHFDSSIGPLRSRKDENSGSRWPNNYNVPNIGASDPRKAEVGYRKVHPIMGGSPFIACYSCFEVLKLPKLGTKNRHNKIKCGACSTILSLESKNKKLIITVQDDKIANKVKEGPLRPRNVRFCTEETECSVDFEQNSSKSEKEKEVNATRSYVFSEDKDGISRDTNKIVVKGNAYEKNLEKNESSETEIECFSNEFDLSQDSIEVKVSEKIVVFVNGQPIPDHIVKKVEKLSGPIQPGDYWYDFEAGFWGVMGHPCLGMIPPFIEEFNYPMPRNCGAGNTSVFVNGRELNEKDLKLLSSRGLPSTEDKFYIIDISGRVYDRDTVKELFCLGKLAPTVEKLKRGFGMKVPRKLLTNEILV